MKKIYVKSSKILNQNNSKLLKIKNYLKKYLINKTLQIKKPENNTTQFIYYHHVFRDEKKTFIEQMKYLNNIGDFTNYENALNIKKYNKKKKERFFVISIDDGFKNNLEICDILITYKIPATFFVPVSFIGNNRDDSGKVFFLNEKLFIDFLDWDDCKKIINDNLFNIESHSVNHANFLQLNNNQVYFELNQSKLEIKKKLNLTVKHFACPYGGYNKFRDLEIARKIGYKSFSVSDRRKIDLKKDNFLIKRHNIDSSWDLNFLKFFLN